MLRYCGSLSLRTRSLVTVFPPKIYHFVISSAANWFNWRVFYYVLCYVRWARGFLTGFFSRPVINWIMLRMLGEKERLLKSIIEVPFVRRNQISSVLKVAPSILPPIASRRRPSCRPSHPIRASRSLSGRPKWISANGSGSHRSSNLPTNHKEKRKRPTLR